jgi:hypothetical protein
MARILVVDDQPEVAELVQAVLKDEGHAADAVYSGQAAWTDSPRRYTTWSSATCGSRTSTGRRSSEPSRSWALRGRSCCS